MLIFEEALERYGKIESWPNHGSAVLAMKCFYEVAESLPRPVGEAEGLTRLGQAIRPWLYRHRAGYSLTTTRIGVGLNPLQGLRVCGQFETTASTRDSARSST